MKRYKFLLRLISVFTLAVFIPTVALFLCFGQKYYKEMEKANENYYIKLTESFAEAVYDELALLEQHATSVCLNSKQQNSAFWLGEESWTSNVYWYYEAVNEMRTLYTDCGVDDYGIYYYASDSVITKGCRQTRATYETNTLELDSGSLDFFDDSSWQMLRFIFGTTNTDSRTDGDLLVGYCVQLGKNSDKALIFYRLSPQSCDSISSFVRNNNGIEFYVLDKDSNQIYLALHNDDGEIQSPSREELQHYQVTDRGNMLTFSTRILSDSLHMQTNDFYKTMNWLWIISAVVLYLLCIVSIYIAYRPLNILTKELSIAETGELETIRTAIHSRDVKLRQQCDVVDNLLVDHLLYGQHISRHHLRELGLDIADGMTYCVYIIEGETFLMGQIAQLQKAVDKQFSIKIYITDTEDERKNVAIAFLDQIDATCVADFMHQWLREHFSAEYHVSAGKTVNQLDDIRTSFVSCYTKADDIADLSAAKKDLKSLESKEQKKQKLLEDILLYLDQHFCDSDLNQPKVADLFNISTYTLSRMFNSQVGAGFSEYINTKRINLSKELLITTDKPVQDISLEVGITNYNYFLRLFKSTMGLTPTAYRATAPISEIADEDNTMISDD